MKIGGNGEENYDDHDNYDDDDEESNGMGFWQFWLSLVLV